MTNWEEIRKQFPVLEKTTYLNPAGGSPMSLSAAAEGKRYFDEMVNEGDLPYEKWMERTEETRHQLSALINASPAEIGFTTNTSTGMNIISLMLKGVGDVLTLRDEFPSSTIGWINNGFKVSFVEPLNYTYPVEEIEKQITPQKKILVASYVQYRTGYRQDLKALGLLCKKHQLIYVVNATQGIGVMPIDVKEAGIDFMAFSGLKWMTSGYGAGVVYISSEMLEKYKLPVAGWQSTESPETMDNADFKIRHEASAIEAGCPHFPSIFALNGALDLINSIGILQIHQRVIYLNNLLQQRVETLGLPVIVPPGDENRSGILIIKTKNAKKIKEELAAKNIFISVRGEGIRVSVSYFNNETDIEVFISEAGKIKDLFFEI
jgi:cysteine desulfurase / selenocysteine lyase